MEETSLRRTDEEHSEPTIPVLLAEPEDTLVVAITPGYIPTRWKVVNAVLERVDHITHGRAGWIQRFCTYVLIGGFAAIVNEVIFSLLLYGVSLPVSEPVHNIIASVVAGEISIMTNFTINDYVTFRHLLGHQRSWGARCLRFHVTAVGGALLTVALQVGFTFIGHIPPVIGQALAIAIVFVYNFTFHHIFTYRHVKAT